MKLLAVCLALCLMHIQPVSAQTSTAPQKSGTAVSGMNSNTTDDGFGYRDDDAVPSEDLELNAAISQRPMVGKKKALLVVGHWNNGYRFDTAKLWKQTFSDDPLSFRSYIRAASGGKLLLEGQMISAEFGIQTCGLGAVWRLGDAAAKAQNIAYDYLVTVVDCGGGASAYVPGNTMGVYGAPNTAHVFNHEFGHSLGYHHGGTYINCPKTGVTVFAPEQCTVIGYRDTGDSVSGGNTLYPAHNRWYSGWLDDSQAAVISQTGLYRLTALGTPGPQSYVINRPTSPTQIALEFRQPTPFDGFSADDNRVTGVWIRYTNMGGTVSNIQLDATPQTASTNDPTLQPGQVLEDTTAKVKVAVCTADKAGVTLAVAFNDVRLPDCTTTVPAPTIDTPAQNAQTGFKPVIAGTGWPGAVIQITDAQNPNTTMTTTADAHGRWSISPATNQSQGNHTIAALQVFGNSKAIVSAARMFKVIDLVVQPPVIETPVANSASGANPQLSGTGIPGAHIRVVQSGLQYSVLSETTVDAYGKWNVTSTWTLPPGPFSISAWQQIDGKRSGWAVNRPFTVIDSPAAPIIDTPVPNSASGANPQLSGTGIPGAHIRVVQSGLQYSVLAETTVDAYGKWNVTSTWTLPPGPFSISAWQQIDGKRSGWAVNRPFTVNK